MQQFHACLHFSVTGNKPACFKSLMSNDAINSDLKALANEALDLWQEHLAAYSNDPKAKQELMRLMAPAQQLFAEWAVLMQQNLHGDFGKHAKTGHAGGAAAGAYGGGGNDTAQFHKTRAATSGTASDGGSVAMAQLAQHAEKLEKRVADLEKRLAEYDTGSGGAAGSAASPRKPRSKH